MRTFISLLALGLLIGSPAAAQLHLWEQRYGNDTCQELATAAVPTENGGAIVIGRQCNGEGVAEHRGWLYAFTVDGNGTLLSQQTGTPAYVVEPMAAARRAAGGLLIVGRGVAVHTASTDTLQLYVATLNGDVLNESFIGGPDWDIKHAAALADGGFIVSGTKGEYLLLVRVAPTGEIAWSHEYLMRGVQHMVGAPTPTSDGGFAVTGGIAYSGVETLDAFLMRVDASGNEVYWRTIGAGPYDRGQALVEREDGSFIVAVLTGTNRVGDAGGIEFVLTDRGGHRVSGSLASNQSQNVMLQMVPNGNGYVAVGTSSSSDGRKLTLLKSTVDGELEWTWRVGVDGIAYDGRGMLPVGPNAFLIYGGAGEDAVLSLVTERPAAVDPIGGWDGPLDLW